MVWDWVWSGVGLVWSEGIGVGVGLEWRLVVWFGCAPCGALKRFWNAFCLRWDVFGNDAGRLGSGFGVAWVWCEVGLGFELE